MNSIKNMLSLSTTIEIVILLIIIILFSNFFVLKYFKAFINLTNIIVIIL